MKSSSKIKPKAKKKVDPIDVNVSAFHLDDLNTMKSFKRNKT